MNQHVSPDDKGWVEHWRRVGPILEAVRRDELKAFRYEDHIDIIDALLDIAIRLGPPRTTSGLVEQQRLFHQGKV